LTRLWGARVGATDRRVGDMKLPLPYQLAVERLVANLPVDEVNWALTGSVAHRLQGADIECHDVDVQTDAPGAYDVATRLHRWVIEPVELRSSAKMRSHLGRLRFDDLQVDVEVMGAVQRRARHGSWTEPTNPSDHRVSAFTGSLEVPVLSLRHEAEAYDAIGRPDRAQLLRHLATRR
jgi:hypothetical protein